MGTTNANSMLQIRNTFYNFRASTVGNWGLNATYDMGYYRGKQYVYNGGQSTATIPATGDISIAELRAHANTIGN